MDLMSTTETVAHACHRCGAEAPYDFGDLWLCLDCYHVAGSTCAGIGPARESSADAAAPDGAGDRTGAVC